MTLGSIPCAVVPGYYLVCYNSVQTQLLHWYAVVPGYYLVCYNVYTLDSFTSFAVVPGYYLVCYNRERRRACEKTRVFSFVLLLIVIIIAILHKKGIVPLTP